MILNNFDLHPYFIFCYLNLITVDFGLKEHFKMLVEQLFVRKMLKDNKQSTEEFSAYFKISEVILN